MQKLTKPEIDNETLVALMKIIRPVVRKNGKLWLIAPCDPRGVAFTWDPKPTERAPELVAIATIPTLHAYGYHGMFKPSIAEVLACIPHGLIDRVCAFETHGPDDANDLNASKWVTFECGMHLASTVLYQRAAT